MSDLYNGNSFDDKNNHNPQENENANYPQSYNQERMTQGENQSGENAGDSQRPVNQVDPNRNYYYGYNYSTNDYNQQKHTYNTEQKSSLPATHIISQKPEKEKKKSKGFFKKFLAVAVVALIISSASIGGFAGLVKAGYIDLAPASSSQETTTEENTTNNNSGSSATSQSASNVSKNSGELTPQEIAAKVIPSVVCIQNYQGRVDSVAGEGSGVVFTKDGYIMTNEHVIRGATSLKVIMYDGTEYDAKVVGSDTNSDLAVIKVEATNLTAVEIGDSSAISVADTVMAIGNPGGLELNSSITSGVVSALNRTISNESGFTMNCIQTDAAINPGNSGGALVNTKGQLIGINSSKIAATGYEGLGFAISINEAMPIIEDLMTNGYVKDRAVLGISYQFIDAMSAQFYRMPSGLYIQQISSQHVIDAGIREGDIITQVEGKDITSTTDITSVLSQKKPGDKLALTVYKSSSGEYSQVEVTLSESKGS